MSDHGGTISTGGTTSSTTAQLRVNSEISIKEMTAASDIKTKELIVEEEIKTSKERMRWSFGVFLVLLLFFSIYVYLHPELENIKNLWVFLGPLMSIALTQAISSRPTNNNP